MTFGKCPFHRMEIGNGNWTGIRNCSPMHLISQMKDWLSGITDWAELSLTGHALPAHGTSDLGSYQKCPLSERKGLFLLSCKQDLRSCAGVREGWNNKKNKLKKERKKELVKRYFITMDSEPTVQQGFAGSRQLCQTAVRTSHSPDNQPRL